MNLPSTEIMNWLLKADVSIQYQVHRDLLSTQRADLKARIENEGWGKRFLSFRNPNGHWGQKFYQPKWISSHYTILDLKNLGIANNCQPIKKTLRLILANEKNENDGGILPIGGVQKSDVCVNGMALNYFSYFKMPEADITSIVDFILSQHMPDGGFNCQLNRKGARHSSLHSTISVLEGISEYEKNQYSYRLAELKQVANESVEFILQHKLYKSDKTGEIIKKDFLKLSYPSRWKYDILRALDYFQSAGVAYDNRMQDAIDVLLQKRNKQGTWNLQAYHPGQLHFKMEEVRKPSHWNTLRALRVLKRFGIN